MPNIVTKSHLIRRKRFIQFSRRTTATYLMYCVRNGIILSRLNSLKCGCA
jgi:hypothetical protein